MPEISFLVLTYNSFSYLERLFASFNEIVGDKITEGKYEIIIVDNASKDNTASEIKKYTKDNIRFYPNSDNNGYAKGINFAAKKAKGKILIVVNPDARLTTSDFDRVVKRFEENEKMAIAGLWMENEDGKREKNAGKFYNILTFALFCLGFDNIAGLRFAPTKEQKVDYVSGGFVAFRKEVFEWLKGYDEDYFMYVEDMDICYRAKKLGYETHFLPFAKVVHKGQGSSSKEFAIVNIYKGLVTFYKKHGSLIELWYVKNLLTLKAALIIFLGSLLSKKELVVTYTKALKSIS